MERIVQSSNNLSEKVHLSLRASPEIVCFPNHFLLYTHPLTTQQLFTGVSYFYTLESVLVWVVKLLMLLELNVCLAEVCPCLPHRAPHACIAASLKARDSYL